MKESLIVTAEACRSPIPRSVLRLVVFVFALSSATPARGSVKLDWSGRLESNLFVGLRGGDLFNYMNTNVFTLGLKARMGSSVAGRARIQFRNINFTQVKSASELGDAGRVAPFGVLVQDLYVDLFGLMWEVLDLRIGQQRVAWGTGYGFNPTDNINPFNLENPLDFESRLGVPAVKGTFYIGEELKVTAVFVPLFTPSVLPVDLFKEVAGVDVPFQLPKPLKLGPINSTELVQTPGFEAGSFQLAGKLSWKLLGLDMSLSYYRGRYSIPVPTKSLITKVEFKETVIISPTVESTLSYPRIQVAGFDLAGSVFGLGIWAEVAVIFPEATDMVVRRLDSDGKEVDEMAGTKLPTVPSIKACEYLGGKHGCPFPKVAAGFDYTAKGGWYFNLQYLYGFFSELSSHQQHHYVFLIFRKSFFRDRLQLQITGGLEIDATEHGAGLEGREEQPTGLAFLVQPQLTWKPFDSAAVVLGGIVARGHNGTSFKMFEQMDQIYLRARMTF